MLKNSKELHQNKEISANSSNSIKNNDDNAIESEESEYSNEFENRDENANEKDEQHLNDNDSNSNSSSIQNDSSHKGREDSGDLEEANEDEKNSSELMTLENFFDEMKRHQVIQTELEQKKLLVSSSSPELQDPKEDPSLNSDQRKQIIERDSKDLEKLLQEIQNSFLEVRSRLPKLAKKVSGKKINLSSGIGFLNSKNHIFLDYIQGLLLYLLHRVSGQTLDKSELIKQLIYYKILIMKMFPVEQKLEYQINKLLQIGIRSEEQANLKKLQKKHQQSYKENAGQEDQQTENLKSDLDLQKSLDTNQINQTEQDPTLFRPRPDLIQQKYLKQQEKLKKSGENLKYIPVKRSATLSKEDQAQERLRVQKQRHGLYLKKKLAQNLIGDDDNQPLRQHDFGQNFQVQDKLEEERERFEEDNFTRLPVTRKDKIKQKQKAKQAERLNQLDNFKDLDEINQLLKYENLIDKSSKNLQLNQPNQKKKKTLSLKKKFKGKQKSKKIIKKRRK